MIEEKHDFFTKETLSQLVADINVAFWVWDTIEDKLYYNNGFYDLVGQPQQDGAMEFETWENLLHPDDCEPACKALVDYCEGKADSYNVEIRLLKGNGEMIWVSDIGKITKYDENGKATQLAGVMEDITERKNVQLQLAKDKNKLKLSMELSGFSVLEWDVLANKVTYDDFYAESLGYSADHFSEEVTDWANIIHKDDLSEFSLNIRKCLSGELAGYDYKLRILKADGTYIWVRDIGVVSERDENGKPIKIIGGRIDINELELTTIKLEKYQENLQEQIEQHTQELQKRDYALLELNEISQKLMETEADEHFKQAVYDCLASFSSFGENSRLTLFKNKTVDGKPFCTIVDENQTNYSNLFSFDFIKEAFKDISIEYISGGAYNEDNREEYLKLLHQIASSVDFNHIDYARFFPTIYKHVQMNKTLNFQSNNIYRLELVFARLQGVKSMMMSPISINNEPWGFILLDNTKENAFNDEDAKILSLVGAVTGQAIHRYEIEEVAREAVEHNELMLNALPICCNLWRDGINIKTNDEASRLFDLDDKKQYLDNFYNLSPEKQPCGGNSSELAKSYVERAGETGYCRFEWVHQKHDGELIPCEVIMIKIPHPDGFLVAGYTRDVRDFKALLRDIEETQEHLRQAHEEAMLSSQAKSNFLANMSHEIRTPMNAISGMTDIILRETQNDEVSGYAMNIKRACDSLLAIINDVLDISKIESGKLDIVESEYSLYDTLNDVLNIASNRLELKPLLFIANFQPNLPDKLIGDDTRVKQVMVNIVNNAIKFTGEGNITFDVYGHYAGGMLELKFSVTDTGVGISDEDIEKLFIEFERVNTKKNRTIEGTGLGLAISKRLCEMMHGTIEVESEMGKGTTFTVTILQKYNEYTPIAEVKVNKSLLVYESRDLYRNSIQQACENLQLEKVVLCSSQSEFNEALQDNSFDFIFTSSMFLLKVQEFVIKNELSSKIILLADNNDIKFKYDYTTIVLPASTISIADVINGKTKNHNNNKLENNFTAPNCNILVVDDNLVNLKVAKGLMRPYLFNIETAENGQEAVEKIKNNEYDLVFMDHMMPIMDGIDATREIRSLEDEYYQKLPIIALTANAIIGTKEIFIKEGMNDFLAKPIKISAINEILSKWLPKEKQISTDKNEDITSEKEVIELSISNIDVGLGIRNIGGDFDTYIDILNMYYKDGLKRIQNIRNLFDNKQLNEYKIEVHALKSASASMGAMDISRKAALLEDASIKSDWAYINQYALEFIDDFNILLENIREALKGIIVETNSADKDTGSQEFYIQSLKELSEALDTVDINTCDELLEKLLSYNWDDSTNNNLNKIKDFANGYEYDEAIEVIHTILELIDN